MSLYDDIPRAVAGATGAAADKGTVPSAAADDDDIDDRHGAADGEPASDATRGVSSNRGAALYSGIVTPKLPPTTTTTTNGAIERTAVLYGVEHGYVPAAAAAAAAAEPSEPAGELLRFHPTLKRPRRGWTGVSASKGRGSAQVAGQLADRPSLSSGHVSQTDDGQVRQPTVRQDVSKLQEWTQTEADADFDDSHARAGLKAKRKSKKQQNLADYLTQWDDDYDPAHPNEYELYIDSDEHIREGIEWSILIGNDDYEEEEAPVHRSSALFGAVPPPVLLRPLDGQALRLEGKDADRTRLATPSGSTLDRHANEDGNMRPSVPTAKEALGEERQIQSASPDSPEPMYHDISVIAQQVKPETGQKSFESEGERNLPSGVDPLHPARTAPSLFSQPYYNTQNFNVAFLPSSQSADQAAGPQTIERAPVRYQRPVSPVNASKEALEREPDREPEDDADDRPASKMPGQAKFAERLMAKYGWSKGQALGAKGRHGLLKPLFARRDKSAQKGGVGVIVNHNKQQEVQGRYGKMSVVVRLENMVRRDEVDEELVQEIGDECGTEVERIKVHDCEDEHDLLKAMKVFVKFTSELSALRAVSTLDGRLFDGRTIKASFYDEDRFRAQDLE